MDITKKELDQFCSNLQDLEDQIKALTDAKKESIEAFATNLEITKKAVNKFYKDWKDAQKNREDFVLVDLESDQLLLISMPELNTTGGEGA